MEGIGVGHGKLILFGEHAAVYGHPAMGVPLPLQTTVKMAVISSSRWKLPSLSSSETHKLKPLIKFLLRTFPGLTSFRAVQISIDSNIPIGVGFGSSAALCVGLVKAACDLLKKSGIPSDKSKKVLSSKKHCWQIAHEAEKFFHGTPSGIDTGLSVLGGLRTFRGRHTQFPKTRIVRGKRFYIIVGAVPRKGNTKKLVGNLREKVLKGDIETKKTLEKLGDLSSAAVHALCYSHTSPAKKLGNLTGFAQELLAKLNLSTKELNKILSCGIQAGALGGKLSGAGGGGAFYLVSPGYKQAKIIEKKVKRKLKTLGKQHAFPVTIVECT